MRTLLYCGLLLGLSVGLKAQVADSAASTLSPWQHVLIQRSDVALSLASRVVIIDDLFTDNRRQWPLGEINGFSYEMGPAGYSIRRLGKQDSKSGRAVIDLPDSLNLNRAGTFIIEVEMVVPKGTAPEGGLLIGVNNKADYVLLVLTGQTTFVARRVMDGTAGPAYRSGAYAAAGAATGPDANHHTLRVEKHDSQLFFAIDGREVPGDAVAFRKFKGNGIGLIGAADITTFRNLRITVGLP